jgi:hypothetical protein
MILLYLPPIKRRVASTGQLIAFDLLLTFVASQQLAMLITILLSYLSHLLHLSHLIAVTNSDSDPDGTIPELTVPYYLLDSKEHYCAYLLVSTI